MPIRIDRMSLTGGGPLSSGFVFEPGDINIIYGRNETGKTYIVESLISLLFRTGKKSTVEWELRNWESSGKVTVSGIAEKPVSFVKTGKKMEDYWQDTVGLPRDFSRLLVVKGGETAIVRSVDGVGHDLLRSYLSGEDLLGVIEARIPLTLRTATTENGQLNGSNMGDIKERSEQRSSLDRLKALTKEVEEVYASGAIYDLRKKLDAIKGGADALKKAKRHHASIISQQRRRVKQDIEGLPTEAELSRIESDISVCESEGATIRRNRETVAGLGNTIDNYVWTDKALGVYKELASGKRIPVPKPVFLISAVVSMTLALVTGLLHLSVPLIVFTAGAVASAVLYYVSTRRALMAAGDGVEMGNLKVEYKKRFGTELTGRTDLEACKERLQPGHFGALALRKELEERLEPQFRQDEDNVKAALRRMADREPPSDQWRPIITGVRVELKRLDSQVNSYDVALASLDVGEADYLEQDPGTPWDKDRYDDLNGQAADVESELQRELDKLNSLRTRIVQETASQSNEWEDLISALQNRQEVAAEKYRQSTAKILARLQVYASIKEFRKEEDTRIAGGLRSEELENPLLAVTGRYRHIRYEEGTGLVVATDQGEEYALGGVSTGTREQILLAMRVGFSSIAMGGQTAFLILDDAFQHSDWQRRGNLVGQVANLVDSGWQVFYFTMDDNIRDLFLDLGKRFGERFKSTQL
jgi:hypothetical protein